MTTNIDKTAKRIQNSIETDISINTVKEVIYLFLSDVIQTLKDEHDYSIENFGVFYSVNYPDRTAINHLNNTKYHCPEHSVPKFKFSKKVKKEVANSTNKKINSF